MHPLVCGGRSTVKTRETLQKETRAIVYHPIKKYRDLYDPIQTYKPNNLDIPSREYERSVYDGVKKYICPYNWCAYVKRIRRDMTDHVNRHVYVST